MSHWAFSCKIFKLKGVLYAIVCDSEIPVPTTTTITPPPSLSFLIWHNVGAQSFQDEAKGLENLVRHDI